MAEKPAGMAMQQQGTQQHVNALACGRMVTGV
jgi:hypothetical protein